MKVVPQMSPMSVMEQGNFIFIKHLLGKIEHLEARSLHELIIQDILKCSYNGVREGYLNTIRWLRNRRIISTCVNNIYEAGQFVRKTESNEKCFEICDSTSICTLQVVNKVLLIITVYSNVGQM